MHSKIWHAGTGWSYITCIFWYNVGYGTIAFKASKAYADKFTLIEQSPSTYFVAFKM